MPQLFPDSHSSGKWHHMTWKTKRHFWMELTCPRCDKGWRKSGFSVCWADHWGRETSHKSRFQWYTYMLSSLELNINHYYMFLRFMSDLYSQGQEPMPNIMESKYPQPIDLLSTSCLIEKAVLLFSLTANVIIDFMSFFFSKIISWVLLGLVYSWECLPPTSLVGKMLWIPLAWVTGHCDQSCWPAHSLLQVVSMSRSTPRVMLLLLLLLVVVVVDLT